MKKLSALLAGAALLVSGVAHAGGTIAGTVAFKGPAPEKKKLDMTTDPFCAPKEAYNEEVLVSKDGKRLQNVAVRVLADALAVKPPDTPVKVDQVNCAFRPRVQVAIDGQKVVVGNDDMTLHNVHAYGVKPTFNRAQPPRAKALQTVFKHDAGLVKLRCDVHPWMIANILYSKTPYFAVTDEDGRFEIGNVPPGTYQVEAWHEKYGTRTVEVKVEEGGTVDPKFSFAAK